MYILLKLFLYIVLLDFFYLKNKKKVAPLEVFGKSATTLVPKKIFNDGYKYYLHSSLAKLFSEKRIRLTSH